MYLLIMHISNLNGYSEFFIHFGVKLSYFIYNIVSLFLSSGTILILLLKISFKSNLFFFISLLKIIRISFIKKIFKRYKFGVNYISLI